MIESIDLSSYDLVISTSSCVAKGVIVGPNTYHICYMHSPMRYIWDQRYEYLGRILSVPIVGFLAQKLLTYLRLWDVSSSTRVDQFIANSKFVQRRIQKYYGRNSALIHPPVDIETIEVVPKKGDYYLVAGALVPYKRVDLALKAILKTNRKLIIAGSGPELESLKKLASGHSNVSFVTQPTDDEFLALLREARALLFPGIEDFGMTPIEAMATGTPLIALAKGGALDYLQDGLNGIGFKEQGVNCIIEAIDRFEQMEWNSQRIANSVRSFSRLCFQNSVQMLIASKKGIEFEK